MNRRKSANFAVTGFLYILYKLILNLVSFSVSGCKVRVSLIHLSSNVEPSIFVFHRSKYLYFSKTLSDVNKKQLAILTIERYRRILEYSSFWKVPPPFCVFVYPRDIYRELRRGCKSGQSKGQQDDVGKKRKIDFI